MRIVSVLLICVLTSCITIYNKNSLQVDKLINNSCRKLKCNGYYYNEYHDKITPMLIFANGYMHEMYSFQRNNGEENPTIRINEIILNKDYFRPVTNKTGIWGWGFWWTNNDSIYIEQYYNYAGNYDIRYKYGIITSDSTFIITKDSSRFKVRFDKQLYKFNVLDSKPDSINYIYLNLNKFGNKTLAHRDL